MEYEKSDIQEVTPQEPSRPTPAQNTAEHKIIQQESVRPQDTTEHEASHQEPEERQRTQKLKAPGGNSSHELPPFALQDSIITIGRLSDNMLVLDSQQVSGHHARLERINGTYRLVDLHSTNHVYVNGRRIKRKELVPGDQIRIGPFQLTYTGTHLLPKDESMGIQVDAIHLKQVGPRRTLLLNDISLDIPARSFVAIVGGSGTGKTTLLNALSGLKPASEGQVLYNGQDYYHNLEVFNTQLGYVPQDDIIHSNLTVRRALYYAARLRLPKDLTYTQIRRRINEVLEDVEMAHRQHTLVRKLSGGERKRVSIALELLANPSIFFLDEPTSGLDPGLDRKMMLLLRKLADKGHTIVLITHTTLNIQVCNYVCFLARGGRLAYYGPPEEAKDYFHTRDFAEIYMALEPTEEQPDVAREAEERFKRSDYYQKYVAQPLTEGPAARAVLLAPSEPITLPRHGHPWHQFLLLSQRYLALLKNDLGNLLLLLLQAPVIALILWFLTSSTTFTPTSIATCPTRANILASSGPIVSINCSRVVDILKSPLGNLIAQQLHMSKVQVLQSFIIPGSGADAQTILFIMGFAAIMFGCINGAREIVKEAPIYRRERMVNLGIGPYIMSKVVVLGILCLLQSAILVYLVNLKAPLHQGIFLPVQLEIYITLALASLAGLMLGLTISTIAPNTDRAMSFVPLVLIPQVIFSGMLFELSSPALQIIGAIFPMRWAMAGMGSSIGLHPDKLGVDSFSYQGTLYVSLNPATAKPGAITHLVLIWCILALIIVVLFSLTVFFLRRKDVRRA
jgi:ABC-type multidrug transport system ATPase subunit